MRVSTSLNLGVKPARMTLSLEAIHSMMSKTFVRGCDHLG